MNIKQVFSDLDNLISYYEKAKGVKPPLIRVNKEQHRLLKKWAEERDAYHQETVVLDKDGVVNKYQGIEVRVQ